MEKLTPVKRLWKLVKTERSEIRNIYLFAIFQGLVGLSLPIGIQAIINLLQAGQLRTSWVVLVVFVLAGILFYGTLQLRLMRITESIEQRLFVKSSFELAFRLPHISTESIVGKYVPEMMNRFFEIMTIQKSMSKLLIDFSAAIVQVLFGLILLSFYHSMFILLAVVLVLMMYIVFRFTGLSGLKSSIDESNQKFAVAHWLEEVSRTLMTFKLSGETTLPLQKADQHTSAYLDARNQHFKVLVSQYKILIFFKLIVAAALIIVGSRLVVNGQINIGQFVAAEIIIIMIINSIEKIILNLGTVYDLLTSLEKVGGITDIPLERDGGEDIQNISLANGHSLRIKDLKFQFKDATTPLFETINLNIKSGEKICLTGNNGSGKTTLLKLLAGMYANYSGSIVINDVPLENINLPSYRNSIAVNFTEQEIFKGTVLDNIICGRPNITLNHVVEICSSLRLNSYIESLASGYEATLDPEGRGLASGVLKKIILARCLVGQPKLLLMEDNLSSFVPEDRECILNYIFTHCKNMTMMITSNSEDIIKRCDREIVL